MDNEPKTKTISIGEDVDSNVEDEIIDTEDEKSESEMDVNAGIESDIEDDEQDADDGGPTQVGNIIFDTKEDIEDEDGKEPQLEDGIATSIPIPTMEGGPPPVVDAIDIRDDDSDSDSDSEEYGDTHLQKFSESIKKDHIAKHHPEIKLHNNNEIEQMAVCVKNSDDIVVDPLHLTNPIMTKFEYTRILGIRTKQLNNGAKPFVKVPEGIVDGYLIAEKELREKKLPFIIKRPIPDGGCEYWNIKDLEIIF